MRAFLPALLLLLVAAACSRQADTREYELQGQILGIAPERREVLIKHGDIKGFMPGMTMPFKVDDEELLKDKQPGDLVTATLVVSDLNSHISVLTRTGHAPLETTPPVAGGAPRILAPGEQVLDALLVDQDGRPLPFSRLRGHRVALTFIYTRCPLPEFCPMMDRHFAAVQKTVTSTPALSDVRLITVTLDPEYDTPAVLKPYSERRNADPAIWSFVTGEPKEVSRFGSQFGLYVERAPGSAANDILHNLVTVVIDADGRLVRLHTGNDWTPTQLVADLKTSSASAH
jgi:protein SCO1/2